MKVVEKAGLLVETAAPPVTESKSSRTRYRARIIEAGQGSSAFYPEKVLEDYASVFRAGTHVYFNHPGLSEETDRPERDVRDLAGKLVSEAGYEDGALYADIEFYSWAAPVVDEMKDDVGLSIRAYGTAVTESGRTTPTLTSFTAVESVDVVTKAGAGGRLVEMLESALPVADPEITVIREATASQKSEALNGLVRDSLSNIDYVWVRDYDDTHVWYEVSDDSGYTLYQQTYATVNDVPSSLEGGRVEVRAQTTYVPVATQESTARNTETTPKENHMDKEQEAKIDALAESIKALTASLNPLVESLSTKAVEAVEPKDGDDKGSENTIDPLEAARVLAASGLSEAGQAAALGRVSESVTLDQAIKAQTEYENSIKESARVGRVDVQESTKPVATPFRKIGG